MADLPIACSLQPAELKRRAADLLPGVMRTATTCASITGGYRFEFAPSAELLSALVGVMDAERQCCRFLRFQLTVEPNDGPIRLDVTGPEGTQEFLGGLLNPDRSADPSKRVCKHLPARSCCSSSPVSARRLAGLAVLARAPRRCVRPGGRDGTAFVRCHPHLSTGALWSRLRRIRWGVHRPVACLGMGRGWCSARST